MKKCLQAFCRISSWLLTLLMLFGILPVIPLSARAASVTKTEKSYEIAVVFDNSGSMYQNQAWCRAKYAMEIFASMLNYEQGDRLKIFTMWEITTDGSKPTSGGSFSVDINSKADIDKISRLYTVHPSNTPFAPITEAYEYLQTSAATEKWLIVLTDGAFNQDARGKSASINLQSRLSSLASDKIKVQYLGFGGATELRSQEAGGFYAKKSSDTSLKDDLIGICNAIFQRSVLPDRCLSGTTLKLDLSMRSLIVFAQGSNAKITSLTDESGSEIPITLDSGQRRYSEIKAKGYDGAPVDSTLAGQVVTFGACPKGTYTLNCSGADAVQIFYEPDVAIQVTLTNSDGEPVDGASGELTAGEYTVSSAIVDSRTGEDVTAHELMGSDVRLTTKVRTSQNAEYQEYGNGAKILLDPDASTEILVVGTYLKDYTITSADNPALDWLDHFTVRPPEVAFALDAAVLQPQSWYKLRDRSEWQPIRVTVTADGRPLTDAQLASTRLSVNVSDELPYRCETVAGASAFDIYLGQQEAGEGPAPDTGKYHLTASAVFTDEYGEEHTAADTVTFEIQRYSKFWRWLLWILILLALLVLIMMILNHPVMPSAIYLNIKRTCHTVKINGTSVGLSTDLYPGEIKCEAKACTPLKNRGKTTAAFEIKGLKPIGSVNWYEIDGSRFKKVNGRYVNDDGETIEQVKPRVQVSDDTELKWNTNRHTITGRIYINHNE